MKRIAHDVEGGKLFVCHLDTLRLGVFIAMGLDAQSVSGGLVADKIYNDVATKKWALAPIGRDVAKHAVLDLVPLVGSRRKVADLLRQVKFVDQYAFLEAQG